VTDLLGLVERKGGEKETRVVQSIYAKVSVARPQSVYGYFQEGGQECQHIRTDE
jgi:hypothetical protein